MRQEKTRQSASDVAVHRLGQDRAYFAVREILAEASTVRLELTAEGNRTAKGGTMARA